MELDNFFMNCNHQHNSCSYRQKVKNGQNKLPAIFNTLYVIMVQFYCLLFFIVLLSAINRGKQTRGHASAACCGIITSHVFSSMLKK